MKILSKPKNNAKEYGRWAVNPYLGCTHECSYCYLKEGVWKNTLGGNMPVLKKGLVSKHHAYHVAMAEILENREQIIRDGGLFMTFTSDPCNRETRELFFSIIDSCIGYVHTPKDEVIPVMLLTKDATFVDDADSVPRDRPWNADLIPWNTTFGLRSPEVLSDRTAFGFTLTGHDEMEPHASKNAERIKTLKWLSDRRYRTWASIEPVIDFESSYQMVRDAVAVGCEHFKIGLMTKRTRVCRSMYDAGEAICFINHVMAVTEGLATVYWKHSFADFFDKEGIDGEPFRQYVGRWKHNVDERWSMFDETTR